MSVDLLFFCYRQFIILIFYLRPTLQYASPVCNNVTSTNANKLERTQRKFASLCFKRYFFPYVHYNYAEVTYFIKLDGKILMLFFYLCYLESKFCTLLDNISLKSSVL
jgi:hypothetical protein